MLKGETVPTLEDMTPSTTHAAQKATLIPRFQKQGYDDESITARREWIQQITGANLVHVRSYSIQGEQMRGNIATPIVTAQIPISLAPPLMSHRLYTYA